jgi:hypothetical protein
MIIKRLFYFLLLLCMGGAAMAQTKLSANERMSLPGPQTERLKKMTGIWDVTMTVQFTPDASPIVVKGLTATRTMVGQYLQETMKPDPSSGVPDFTRISHMLYNKADNRWEYVSIDTRISGIMNRENFGNEQGDSITLHIMNFTLPGFGEQFDGKALRLRDVLIRHSVDKDELKQYWTPAGGKEWMAVHYEYTRRK